MVRLARFFKSTLTISAAAAAIFLSPITAMGQRGALDLEILSKDDVGAIFAMTRAEWTENVRRAVMAGAASATGSPESGLAMVTESLRYLALLGSIIPLISVIFVAGNPLISACFRIALSSLAR